MITPTTGLTGQAIVAASGNVTVSNAGTVTGLIDLGAGVNSFTNEATGVVNAGASLLLGTSSGVFTNKGSLAPGRSASIQTTTLSGDFVQTGTGKYLVDVTANGADKTVVTGTAVLGGTVHATLHPGGDIAGTYTILSASGVSGNFTALSTSNLPAGFSARLRHTGMDVQLLFTRDLSGDSGGGQAGARGSADASNPHDAPRRALGQRPGAG